jgi:hypothetical protein
MLLSLELRLLLLHLLVQMLLLLLQVSQIDELLVDLLVQSIDHVITSGLSTNQLIEQSFVQIVERLPNATESVFECLLYLRHNLILHGVSELSLNCLSD